MLGKIFGVIVIISVVVSFFTGKTEAVGLAVADGAASAVQLTIALAGMMCLWNGVISVLKEAGFMELLAKAISPVLRLLYPDTYRAKKSGDAIAASALQSICASISANILGIGNAATPLGIDAMKKLSELDGKKPAAPEKKNQPVIKNASRDMLMLVVFNCASLQIIPTTLFALRSAAGSANTFEILVPVWICSIATVTFSVVLMKIIGTFRQPH